MILFFQNPSLQRYKLTIIYVSKLSILATSLKLFAKPYLVLVKTSGKKSLVSCDSNSPYSPCDKERHSKSFKDVPHPT